MTDERLARFVKWMADGGFRLHDGVGFDCTAATGRRAVATKALQWRVPARKAPRHTSVTLRTRTFTAAAPGPQSCSKKAMSMKDKYL